MLAIKKFREARGMAQSEFAAKLHVSQQTVSCWERGEKNPRADKFLSIAKLLNCSIDELLSDDKEKEAVAV